MACPNAPPDAGGHTMRHTGHIARGPLDANGITSRTPSQSAADALSSTISADPNDFSVVLNDSARCDADAVMPSRRIMVSDWSGEAISPSGPCVVRNADPGRCAAPETSKGEPSAAVIALLAAISSSPRSRSVSSLSARGITFSVTSVITDNVPHAPASSLQTATGLVAVAETGHRMQAKQMIAHAAGLDPPRTREPGRDHAADGADIRRAQQLRRIHRLERKLLVLGIDQRQHVGDGRAGLYGEDQLVRLVGRHGIQRRQIEQRIGRHGLSDHALATMANNFQRLLAGNRRTYCLLDVLSVSDFQNVHGCVLLKSRQIRKSQLAAMHVHTAEFGAAMQRWKHLAGIEQPL
jgi:hypothetical protein